MSTETAAPTQLERLTMELLGLPTATRARLAHQLLISLRNEEYSPQETSVPTQLECLMMELLDLPIATQERLVEQLIKGLEYEEYPPQEDVTRRQLEIVRQRIEDFDSGKVKGIPGEEVFRKLRENVE